ncbi:MAG: UDP-N-acetylmuramoyl-tripeptide--D-alanyl-D-alanine ligase [Bryobacteraceae bacterium]|nr:UDP-N-acetylmuramoyl-tripeptide--D-alanyl-D-alanine ligase [Bryobacteraceae bacterium]
MTLDLQDVATAMGSPARPPSIAVSGWSVDSRTAARGDVFFALRGPAHDGHEYVWEAFSKGAVAAVVDQPLTLEGTLLPVADAYRALAETAAWARQRWRGTVVGVTGSAGKTTTKDFIARVLATKMPTGKTTGNFNNHVGLPLSILRLPDNCRAAVLEIAMNHPGEIRQLSAIARPAVGVVTNVGYAHVEFFDSIEGVALAKRELIEALPPEGTAVLNADDERVARFREIHPGPTVTFGFAEGADLRAAAMETTPDGARFLIPGAGWFATKLAGRHAVRNALAALAVARVFGYAPEEFRDAIAGIEAGPMRGRRFFHHGITILDDCYNANPEAVRAMIDAVAGIPARQRVAVLGEMLELGAMSEALHREVGRYAAERGIDVLIGVRGAARYIVESAVEAGLPTGPGCFFEDPEPAGIYARSVAGDGDVVLFKGSRGTRVERALESFLR